MHQGGGGFGRRKAAFRALGSAARGRGFLARVPPNAGFAEGGGALVADQLLQSAAVSLGRCGLARQNPML